MDKLDPEEVERVNHLGRQIGVSPKLIYVQDYIHDSTTEPDNNKCEDRLRWAEQRVRLLFTLEKKSIERNLGLLIKERVFNTCT